MKTDAQREKFLAALADGGTVQYAAKAAGIGRRTAYDWREADEEFAQAWDDAIEDAIDSLETSALMRARDGVVETVVDKAGNVYENRRYSDSLVAPLLKGRRSKIYRDRTELSGPEGGPIEVTGAREQLDAKLAALAAKREAKGAASDVD